MDSFFSYFIFFYQPLKTFAFFSLIMAFVSLWIYKRPWLYLSFLAITLLLGYFEHLLEPIAFIPLAVLATLHLLLKYSSSWKRLVILFAITLTSLGLLLHLMPGFHNWLLVQKLQISPNSLPYTLYLNLDKPFIGFFPLAFALPLIQNRFHFKTIIWPTLLLTALGIAILAFLSLSLQIVKVDYKFPHITFIWLVSNLFLTTIPEEAFFRGTLQKEIATAFQTKWGEPLSIVIVSLLFAALHFGFVGKFSFVIASFVASVIYGTIYSITRSIESSILCHYLFNIVHFFFFTYPALQ